MGGKLSKTLEVAFIGEVHPASCECHAGQWFIGVLVISPQGPMPIGHDWFPSEAVANENTESTVKKFARLWLDEIGVDIDSAVKMTVANGDDAVRMAQSVSRNTNPNLH